MKKEIFKDIQIIERKGGINPLRPVHTIAWRFEYKGNKYGNLISDQVGTGKFYKYWDDDESCELTGEYMKTVPLTKKDQIGLMKNMIEVMEKLIYPLPKVTPKMVEKTIKKLEKGII